MHYMVQCNKDEVRYMAESQSKVDIAAEKAFADAAEKKASDAVLKPAAAAPAAGTPAAAVKAEAAPQPVGVSASRPTAKKAAPKKKAVRKAAAKKAGAKPVATKPAARKLAAKKPVARAARKTSTSVNTPIKHLKDKIMATTKTNTTDFTAKMQETTAGMQTRAKAAYAKGTEMTADVTAFHKGNFDALVESGKVLAATMQDLGRTAVEDARNAAETVTADVKAMAAVKSPTELLQLQGEIARRNLDTIVARTSKNAEVMMKLANDMFAPLSTRASLAMERLNKAA
jgi:phasin family protein